MSRDEHVAATASLDDEQRTVLEVYSRTHAGLVPDAIQAILSSHDAMLGEKEATSENVEARLPESLGETFDAIRGDLHVYELGECSFKSLLRGLRESLAVLNAKEAKRGS